MRKFIIYFLAAFIVTSCDNLKTKNETKSDDDTEETVKKKKKKSLDDEEESTSDEETSSKKKKTSDDLEEDDKSTVSNRDDESTTATWDKANRKIFMDNCVGKAEPNVGYDRAKQYCSCMLGKIENAFPDPNDVSGMTTAQREKMVAQCNAEE